MNTNAHLIKRALAGTLLSGATALTSLGFAAGTAHAFTQSGIGMQLPRVQLCLVSRNAFAAAQRGNAGLGHGCLPPLHDRHHGPAFPAVGE